MSDEAFESILHEISAGEENLAIAAVEVFMRKRGDINRRCDEGGFSLLHIAVLKNFLEQAAAAESPNGPKGITRPGRNSSLLLHVSNKMLDLISE